MLPPDPGEHSVSDLIFHGRHPFPAPVERLILQIHQANPRVWQEFAGAAEGWTRLPPSEESCGRVVDFLNHILRDLDDRGARTH
jgi:hypothetical protein